MFHKSSCNIVYIFKYINVTIFIYLCLKCGVGIYLPGKPSDLEPYQSFPLDFHMKVKGPLVNRNKKAGLTI